jgi:hypothetical protein
VQTNKPFPNNKPTVIILGNEKGTNTLIDIALSGHTNENNRKAKSILKCKVLAIEMQCLWEAETK